MGVVYKARQVKANRLVALKMILSRQHAGLHERVRFQIEAEAVARLTHPNIVHLHEVGDHDGLPFFSLEFCAGGSLDGKLQGRPLPPAEAAALAEKLARAVHYAHLRGVVHRDLKPANVLLTADGEPKITDFGLAKQLDSGSNLSQSGSVMGTPSYMAPEQAAGRVHDTGPAADVHSLGAVFYQLLTGRPPFEGATAYEVIQKVMSEEPVPPGRLNPTVPPDLGTICLKCLHKEPARRYASAEALADDLRRWREGRPIAARPVGQAERFFLWVRRRPGVAGLLAVLATVIVAAFAVITWQWRETRAALEREDRAKRERALAQVNALRDAAPGAVPGVLADLERHRPDVLPRLRELWAEGGDEAKRMRVALALLPAEPEAVRDDLVAWMLKADSPAEVLLVREALRPYRADVRPGLWARAADDLTPPGQRFRALVALAAFDPDSSRWAQAGDPVVRQLLAANPLHLGTWAAALRRVRGSLLGPLTQVFRGGRLPAQRQAAAVVLADLAADRPDLLGELVLEADPDQYAVLRPGLSAHREQARARMRRELAVELAPDWKDAPLDPAWAEPAAELRREVESADGLLAERFALCQRLPLERLAAVAEGLRRCGYRPVKVRPWAQGDAVRAAVVWTRDGRDWHLAIGLGAEEVQKQDQAQRQAGRIPEDAAGYRQGDWRYAVVWVRAKAGEVGRLDVGRPHAEMEERFQEHTRAGFLIWSLQMACEPDGGLRYCWVWRDSSEPQPSSHAYWGNVHSYFESRVAMPEHLLVDVSLVVLPAPDLAGQWRRDLEQADKAVAAKPGDAAALTRRGQLYLRLGQEDRGLADLDAAIRAGPPANAYALRAQVHARAGRARQARADLEEFCKKVSDVGERARLKSSVAVFLEEEAVGLKELEETLSAHPNAGSLTFQAAGVYARAARVALTRQAARAAGLAAWPGPAVLFAPPPGPANGLSAHAGRALELLRQARANGYRELGGVLFDPDFETFRGHPGFRALMEESGAARRYANIWLGLEGREGAESHGLDPAAHLARCRELAGQGWRPAALAATGSESGGVVTASAWLRPVVPEAERERLARRQAQAAVTLLSLSDAAPVWPLFRQSPEPDLRSQLVWRAGLLGLDPKPLVRHLLEERDVSARRALVLALGEFTAEQLPPAVRGPLTETLLRWYRDDPDPGLHGAIDWLLRHGKEGPEPRPLEWGQAEALRQEDERLKRRDPDGLRDWYVNGQGQTYVVITGPVEFRMGAPLGEVERTKKEIPHRRRIGRSYAIAAKDVTLEQWRRFLKDRPDMRRSDAAFSPDADGPAVGVSWYDAARYCNWLSEKEGIPDTEWCYPKHADIKAGMKPLPDYLTRKGYRLPTEAEWEYACRAGTTSSRYHGCSLELLPRYAWHLQNARNRAWPVGQKRPNDLGLFDMLGNVFNWCNEGYDDYRSVGGFRAIFLEDREDTRAIDEREPLVLRGSSFETLPPLVRSASRGGAYPMNYWRSMGVRPVRTLP
jgi:formylglycine-generating enzyme required for sulfatase activity/tRNA A-37 threonylcarbamoyl transferase component Bud32